MAATTFPAPNLLGPPIPVPPRPAPGQTALAPMLDAAAQPFVRTAPRHRPTDPSGRFDLDATSEFALVPPPAVTPGPAAATSGTARRNLAIVVFAVWVCLFAAVGTAVGMAAAARLSTTPTAQTELGQQPAPRTAVVADAAATAPARTGR